MAQLYGIKRSLRVDVVGFAKREGQVTINHVTWEGTSGGARSCDLRASHVMVGQAGVGNSFGFGGAQHPLEE